MTITIEELLLIMGVPTAATGLAVWWLKRCLDKRDKHIEEREKARTELECATIASVNAAIALAEATANAVARIPDAHCNGDMHSALEYARDVKHKQKEMLTRLGIEALN